MSLVTGTISNLIEGVSQQPALVRFPSQLEAQSNCYSSPVEGLKDQPPTEFVAKVIAGDPGNAFCHIINRDATERYIAIFTQSNLRVFSLIDGKERKVAFPDGTSYLNLASPQSSLRCVTVADYTFVVNTTKTVALDAATSANRGYEGLAFVKRGNYSTNYKVYIDGTERATYTTSDTVIADLRTDTVIAEDLKTDLATWGGGSWTITRVNSVVHVKKNDGSTFALTTQDSQGGAALIGVMNSIQHFNDLPIYCLDGFRIKVSGDPDSASDDYWVKFVTNGGGSSGEGRWEECVAQGIQYKFDAATMPHVLVRESDGTFTFKKATWDERTCGDVTTNPTPSFVGTTIRDMIFWKNRLGFLADENIIFSEVGQYFNFWRTTVTTIVDGDPIDVSVAHTKVSILNHAVPFDQSLVLFSDQTQFLVEADGPLTSKSIKISPTTEYENSGSVKPIGVGSSVLFGVNKGDYDGVREYYIENQSLQQAAEEITSHIPKYIPATITKMVAATGEDVVACLSSGAVNKVFIYKFYNQGQQRVQSSWSQWDVGSEATILDIGFLNLKLYLLVKRTDGVYVESVNMAPGIVDTGVAYITHLNQRIMDTQCLNVYYDSGLDKTFFTLPWYPEATPVVATRQVNPGGLIDVSAVYAVNDGDTAQGGAKWSQSGLGAFTAANVNDKDRTNTAFNCDASAAGSYLQLDLGAAGDLDFQTVKVWKNGIVNAVFDVQYSDNGTDWTTATSLPTLADTGFVTTVTWRNVGAHRYWRLYKTNAASAGAVVYDVQFRRESRFSLVGNYSTTKLWIGRQYTRTITFSPFYIRQQNGPKSQSVSHGKLQIRTATVFYDKTGYFRIEVTPLLRDTSVHDFTGRILGAGTNLIGEPGLPAGKFRVPVLSNNENVTIQVINDSIFPMRLLSAEWEGEYVPRARTTS